MNKNEKAFSITRGKGFHMRFKNGYTISVQWGSGNYCDNYTCNFSDLLTNYADGKYPECDNAECAVIDPDGELIALPEWATSGIVVTHRSTPKDVLRLMNWASKRRYK